MNTDIISFYLCLSVCIGGYIILLYFVNPVKTLLALGFWISHNIEKNQKSFALRLSSVYNSCMSSSPRIRPIIPSRIGLLLFCLLLFFGCGYHLAGGLNLPSHIKSIAVPIFQNHTAEPDIEKVLTEAVIERIQSLGQVSVTTVDRADAVLYGTVNTYTPRIPLSFDDLHRVREYRLKIGAQLKLVDVRNGQVIWEKHKLTAKTEYLVSDDVLGTQDAERNAQEVAAFEMARDLITMWEGGI
jgi:outer membrane lipopolysaccharide assembly protein LptE/RlpB